MLPQEIIRRKRNGEALAGEDIAAFVAGLTDDRVTEGQAAAFAMAVYFRGMSVEERIALTTAMRDSGRVLDWSDLPGPVLDKHSTGGVGDNLSLMLAPALAACGVFVPMISGRGLGHTGGTLDKLDSIPGYTSQPDIETFRRVTADVGCAIIGQTVDLAPADRRLYAIRDVTATVESIDLITASILSKKLAAGLDVLVLDVKSGSGAFMASLEEARALAEALTEVANGAGTRCAALLTDMDQPLARAAGNAVEIRDAIDFLTGASRDPRQWEVTCALGAEALGLCGQDDGRARLEAAFESGKAAEVFARMVAALGGPADLLEAPDRHLPAAPVIRPVDQDGTVAAIDTRAIGLAVIELGGGRTRPGDPVDPAVGFTGLAGPGDSGRLGTIHARDEAAADRAEARLRAACTIGTPPSPAFPIFHRIGP